MDGLREVVSPQRIADALQAMAREVVARFGEEEPVTALALLNGALWFAADLLRLLPDNFQLETVRVGSYGDARETSGSLRWEGALPDCRGARVLVLDEVLDSGVTLSGVVAALREAEAAEVATAVVVDKASPRRATIEPDFAAFRLGDAFLVGYGMDDAGRFRNLPGIFELLPDSPR